MTAKEDGTAAVLRDRREVVDPWAADMEAWWVERPDSIAAGPLRFGRRLVPRPDPDELLVRVEASGVCRTDLHLAEGDLAPRQGGVIPGHEIVGRVEAQGANVAEDRRGQRVGVAWLRWTCGGCRHCREGHENLCRGARFTGWDDDGGFAEYAVVNAEFAYPISDQLDPVQVAPLLCSGIIGYRALCRAELPTNGRLGIYGFGASAHITAQIALHQGARVHVMTRSEAAQRLALELGCHTAAGATATAPEPLDSAILFAPAGELVPVALRALDRGGTLAIAGIHVSDIPPIDYAAELFHERQVRSVTANTRVDGHQLLALAETVPLRVKATSFRLDEADRALRDLAADRIVGAAVLVPTAPSATAGRSPAADEGAALRQREEPSS